MPFLPITKQEMHELGWTEPDFVLVTGDAYVDHPTFGVAIISRVLESHGYKVAILSQPDWRTDKDFTRFGKPRLGFMVTAGNIDSMVAHYTAARRKRSCIHKKNQAVVPRKPRNYWRARGFLTALRPLRLLG